MKRGDSSSDSDDEPMISSPDSSDKECGVFKFHAQRFNKETVVHHDNDGDTGGGGQSDSSSSPLRGFGRVRRRKHSLSLEDKLKLQARRKQLKFQRISARVKKGAKKLFHSADDDSDESSKEDDDDNESNEDEQPHKNVISIEQDPPTFAKQRAPPKDVVELLESSDEEDNYKYRTGYVNYAAMEATMSAEAAEALRNSRMAAMQLQRAQRYHAEDIFVHVETPMHPLILAGNSEPAKRPKSPPASPGRLIRLVCRALVNVNGKKQPEKKSNLTIRINEKLSSLLAKFLDQHDLPTTAVVTMHFDGQALDYSHTPKYYQMEDYDLIDVQAKSIMISMQAVANKVGPKLKLTVRERQGKQEKEHEFSLGKQQSIQHLFDMYQKEATPRTKYIFQFDGEKLDPQKTPAAYDMENGDLIDVVHMKRKSTLSPRRPTRTSTSTRCRYG